MPSSDTAIGEELIQWRDRAMASQITIQARPPRTELIQSAAASALRIFKDVERACSRFDATSGLSRCNRRPSRWHRVPAPLLDAIREARQAHETTLGLFDPRVHDVLIDLGYARSFELGADVQGSGASRPVPSKPWRVRSIPALHLIRLDGSRIDLGGIAKGLAVRWSAAAMYRVMTDFLIEAGGDVWAAGKPRPGGAWRVGVESPTGASDPIAVLEVTDRAVATSSTRIRAWQHEGRTVHHLIDPRRGEPGGAGLLAVTVVHEDPAWAEVWSKVLFLAGPAGIAGAAEQHGIATLWARADGTIGQSATMRQYVIWEGPG